MNKRTKKSARIGNIQDEKGLGIAWMVGFLAVAGFLLYANTIGHGFVFDDVTLILQNPQVLDFDIAEIFSIQGYRPVRTLTHAVEWALSPGEARLFHVDNILLHILNVLALFFFLKGVSRSRIAAFAGSLVFLVHPVQTAAVAYISGRKDLLAAGFLLLGFLFYSMAAKDSGRGWKMPAAWACFILALLSKEVSIVFPAMLLGIDMLRDETVSLPDRTGKVSGEGTFSSAFFSALKKHPLQYAVFSVLAILALAWAVFINLASRADGYWGGTLVTNLGTGFKLFAHYLKLVFVPYPLIADYTGDVFPVPVAFWEPAVIFSILLTVFYLSFALLVFRKSPLVSFGMLWFAAALSPVLHFIPFHEIAADHFMYLPMAGIAMSVAGLTILCRGFPATWKKILAAVLLLLVAAGSVMTVKRNGIWKDQKTLWEATYAQAPGSYRANVNLGQIAFSEGRVRDGISFSEKAVELDPSKSVPRNNLGVVYYNMGQQASQSRNYRYAKDLLHMAIEYFKTALELSPERIFTAMNYGSAYKELANIAEAEGDPAQAGIYREEAEKFYMRVLNSGDERKELQFAWINLGMMYIDAGKMEEALAPIDRYLEIFGDDSQAGIGHYWKGYALYSLGRTGEAAESYEKAAAINPSMDVFNYLVNCYEKLGNEEMKIRTFERALVMDPGSFNALYNLGLIYQKKGETGKSNDYYRRALAADPDNMMADAIRQHLGNSGALD